MERAGSAAGSALRAKNSLAGVAGLADLASGGNGAGLRVPLSCALAVADAKSAMAHDATAAQTSMDAKGRARSSRTVIETSFLLDWNLIGVVLLLGPGLRAGAFLLTASKQEENCPASCCLPGLVWTFFRCAYGQKYLGRLQ